MSYDATVAPPAGAWIETHDRFRLPENRPVAPPAGAWIETVHNFNRLIEEGVAPPAGAWIETKTALRGIAAGFGRAPRGRVD